MTQTKKNGTKKDYIEREIGIEIESLVGRAGRREMVCHLTASKTQE